MNSHVVVNPLTLVGPDGQCYPDVSIQRDADEVLSGDQIDALIEEAAQAGARRAYEVTKQMLLTAHE